MGLHAPNVAPIAPLFWRNPTPSPVLLLLLDGFGSSVGAPTRVVIVTTLPSERVEITRETRDRDMSLVVEVAKSVVVEVSDKVAWEVAEDVELE